MDAEYIGDGVYVQEDHFGGVLLTLGSHKPEEAENPITLEREVAVKLNEFLTRFLEKS